MASRGYSLYELLITLAVASVVLGASVPLFGDVVARSRQRAEINALHHAMYAARKQSLASRRVISLCPSDGQPQCQPGLDWSAGWIMFINADRDWPPHVDPGEAVLRFHDVHPQVELTANRKGFTSRGVRQRATNGTFVACDRARRVPPRALVISYTGRPRAATTKTNGDPYRCAD